MLQLHADVGEEGDQSLDVVGEGSQLLRVEDGLVGHLGHDGVLDCLLNVRLVNLNTR